MMKQFRTYQLAVDFYREIQNVQVACHLKDQLNRAASSVPLNLAEGYGRMMRRDKRRFYVIAFGSIREIQAICEIANLSDDIVRKVDELAAHAYKLIKVCS